MWNTALEDITSILLPYSEATVNSVDKEQSKATGNDYPRVLAVSTPKQGTLLPSWNMDEKQETWLISVLHDQSSLKP